MGNPTTYRGYTMTWRGKQLAGFTGGTKNIAFEYNEDGLRQKKTYNGVVTNYYYNGSVLIGMQRGTAKERFSYDAAGNVVSVKRIDLNIAGHDTNRVKPCFQDSLVRGSGDGKSRFHGLFEQK